MGKGDGQGKILVVSSAPELAEITEKAVSGSFEVAYASNQQEGLDKARKEMPDMIVLGYIEPQGTAFELHRKLRGGWITRNIPLLIVDLYPQDQSRRVLTMEEGLQIEADEYIVGGDYEAISRLLEPARFREKLDTRLRERVNIFKETLLDPNTFCVTWEQIAGRGAFEMQQEEIIDNVYEAVKGGIASGISVTDNPGGNPAISTELLCTEIKKLGIEPLVHLACRDKNRNELESLLYGLSALEVRNVLLLTGDAPSTAAFGGKSKPVFDLDPIHGLQLIEMMNKGLEHEMLGKKRVLAPTDLFAGVCVSSFKQQEAELMGQYYKLNKKIQAGAKFIITQVGYDVRKLNELLMWLKVNGYDIPVMANIYILPYGTAKFMNANQIPGCVVTDKLVAEMAEEKKAEDKGKAARLLRAAKMYALAKGMGCAGAHLGGIGISYDTVEYIVRKGEELSENWQDLVAEFDYPQKDGFYYFKRDPKTGLNLDKPNPRPRKPSFKSFGMPSPPLMFTICRFAHILLFEPKSPLFKMLRPIARLIDSTRRLKKVFLYFEHLAKVALFGCMNCGDCAIFDIAYLCPMSQCPKNQRNGPCGGSYEGWCEVYPNEKKCIWVKAYERWKARKEEDKIGAYITAPCDWELWETSSWLNFYLGRDHTAKRLGLKPPVDKSALKKADVAKGAEKAVKA